MNVRTIRCCLCVDEATRKFFWEAMVTYTLLINHLFVEVAKHPQFQGWQSKGKVPRQAIEKLIEEFTVNKLEQLPPRFYRSAVLMTQYVYKGWFKQQKQRRLRLQGKKRWLDAIESDGELAQTTDFSREEICLRAQTILDLADRQGIYVSSKRSRNKPKAGITLLGFLLNRFYATSNLLERRAIIYLLKNDLAVSEQDKDPEILAQQLESKKIEIERVEKQLQSQLPKGRDPTGERYVESLLAAISLPNSEETDRENANLSILKEQKQVELFNNLPYPIIFGSADDLIWSLETPNSSTKQVKLSIEQEADKTKQGKRKKKKNAPSERLCVRFKGLKDAIFKIQCDRRQLSIFRQFLTDYQFHFQAPKQERFSQALFVLKSAQLIWRPNSQTHHCKSGSTNQSQSFEDKPWQTHRLYLHCNLDICSPTAEGTEEVRQQTRQKILKALEGRETLSEEQLQELELTPNQRSHVKRLKSTLSRLENPSPPRPSVIRYQGNPLIAVGVSFNPQTLLTACVVDLQSECILDTQDAKQLLTVKSIKAKCKNRSILQLKLKDWRLVNKLHFRRQRNLLS